MIMNQQAHLSSNNLGVIEVADASLKQQLSSIWKTLGLWFSRMEDRRHLATLDERMLDDFGATRDEVAAEIRKPFWVA